jgi:hypothetical protein
MEKLLIGIIIVLISLAFVPIKSEPFIVANMTQATNLKTNDKDETQALVIRLVETKKMDNSVLVQTENSEYGIDAIEIKQETGVNDRGIFISIGSLVLIGIFLLLPPFKTV